MVENRRRTTKQRLAIRALFDDEPFFLTAQQVHDQLRNRGDQVGLATVYRNLQTMAEDGELDAIRAEDGEMTYRRCSSAHHHHLVCRNCGIPSDGGALRNNGDRSFRRLQREWHRALRPQPSSASSDRRLPDQPDLRGCVADHGPAGR